MIDNMQTNGGPIILKKDKNVLYRERVEFSEQVREKQSKYNIDNVNYVEKPNIKVFSDFLSVDDGGVIEIKVKKNKTWSKIFEVSKEWILLKIEFWKTAEKKCVKCGSVDQLHVDHIKPKSKYKELALEITNLRVLCKACNFAKAAKEE